MQASDFDSFRREILQLCESFNRPASEELVQSYWRALNDLKLSEVQRAVQSILLHGAEKFPKPWELREKRVAKESELPAAALAHNAAVWREKEAKNPERTKIEHEWSRLQLMLAQEPSHSSQYAEALRRSQEIERTHGNPRFW